MAKRDTTTSRKSSSAKAASLSKNSAASIEIGQTGHGITYPKFDANSHIATDLFSDSSNAPRMSRAEADEHLAGIEERRNALEVASANIQLNTDAVKAADKYAKFEGTLIDFATTQVSNQTKLIDFQTSEITRDTAAVHRDTAGVKSEVAGQKLEQEKLTLGHETNRTKQIAAQFEKEQKLFDQKIEDLDFRIQEQRSQLSATARRLNVVDIKAS